MTMRVDFGIDTSNYTTSVAAIAEDGRMFRLGKLLPVREGERGLRQSDALFHHTAALPSLMEDLQKQLFQTYKNFCVASVGVSSRPRNVDGSYMPCFLAGVNAATALSVGSGARLYSFSHQEGHIAAAVYGCPDFVQETPKFYVFHMSGGTCELLLAKKSGIGYHCDIVAATKDITCGQLVDRVGVSLGLSFPCGKALEELAKPLPFGKMPKIAGEGGFVHLSGFENKAEDMRKQNKSPAEIAAFVYDVIRATTQTMITQSGAADTKLPILYAGGVMSSGRLKEVLSGYFTEPALATDNACGIALLAKTAREGEAL